MPTFMPKDLKTILHSKRANIYYLEHCRVLVKGGTVHYATDQGKQSLYWNIPIANTTSLLLGSGTSLTQEAARLLSQAGVLVGFCGGDGTPLWSATEPPMEALWLAPQSEYRPVQYLQQWVQFWFDDGKRLQAARYFQQIRLATIERYWLDTPPQDKLTFTIDANTLSPLLNRYRQRIAQAVDNTGLLTAEAELTKALYRQAARASEYGDFQRAKRGQGADPANRLLDHGNYLAYGLAATATWVLGLPHSLAVLHGKTRRGALVFDVADLVKDALVLPLAFDSAMAGHSNAEFRDRCKQRFHQANALDLMIETLEAVAQGKAFV